MRGDAARLDVRYSARRWHELMLRGFGGVALLAAVMAVHRLSQANWWRALLLRYPQFVVGLGGVAWWLWLSPSIIGWLIVLLALWLSWHSAVRTRPG
jgi:hypothetical protein